MKLSGWGNFLGIDAQVSRPLNEINAIEAILKSQQDNKPLIARGLGRSYGDSALAAKIMMTSGLDHFLAFNEMTGELTCQAGVSLATILEVFVPKGWFLKVTPGTKFVTVGGAIASDVHGKNHHIDGCFSSHVTSLKIATVTQGVVECTRDKNSDLFFTTCGGMGLTGIILEATFKLMPIVSAYVEQTTFKANTLNEALALFDEHHDAHYSVAWIDCLATGDNLGRSLIMLGEHAKQGELVLKPKKTLNMPITMPSFLLNQYAIQAFNYLYYHKVRQVKSKQLVTYESFFYPLDAINNWNRMYGSKGFCQYQFVIPKAAGLAGMRAVLERIATSKRGSFLAVLKAFGPQNKNFLSFPMEGYTLALDFKVDAGLFELLDELDNIVLAYGGRVYLTKDARMSTQVFKKSYSQLEDFLTVRKKFGADNVFHSLQSKRLGI